MKTLNRVAFLLPAFALLALGGCPTARTSDDGGGSLISAGLKVANNEMTTLTQDEIQIVSDFAIQQSGANITPLDNATADAVLEFLKDNNLNSIQEVEATVELAQTDPNAVVIDPDVREALEAFIAANEDNFGNS